MINNNQLCTKISFIMIFLMPNKWVELWQEGGEKQEIYKKIIVSY